MGSMKFNEECCCQEEPKSIGRYEGINRTFFIYAKSNEGTFGAILVGASYEEAEWLQWSLSEAGKSVCADNGRDDEMIYEDEIVWT